MKTWTDVEKTFVSAGIEYRQKDWIFLCEIKSGLFYYSPQSGKWRVKGTRVWQVSNSVEDFIRLAKEYLQTPKESEKSPRARDKGSRKKRKSQKTKTASSKKKQNYQNYQQNRQDLRDKVRPEFLELFDEKVIICNERNYKPAWVWKVLLDKHLLTPTEICWLCTVFDYSPGWAFHQVREQHPSVGYRKIWVSIQENKSDWLKYFNSRWQFSQKQEAHQQRESYKQQKSNRDDRVSTQGEDQGSRYQSYLDILRLKYPFDRQELKIAYRQKALETHPDMGGTTETFRRVHAAFEILSPLAR